MLVSNWRHVCYFWWDKLILKGSDYEIDKYVFLLAAIGSKKYRIEVETSLCADKAQCVLKQYLKEWWLWNMMMMIHSFVHSFKQNEIHGGWSALREWLHQTRRDLRIWEINQIGGNIRNRLIIISWDHFNDFEDFEEDGQLDLLVVYFPLKMYIFLFDLEILQGWLVNGWLWFWL